MTKIEINSIIDEIWNELVSADSILCDLRQNKVIEESRFDALIANVEQIIPYYADKEMIPTKLAGCFVDIYSAFNFNENIYSEAQRVRLSEKGAMLSKLALKLCS